MQNHWSNSKAWLRTAIKENESLSDPLYLYYNGCGARVLAQKEGCLEQNKRQTVGVRLAVESGGSKR